MLVEETFVFSEEQQTTKYWSTASSCLVD